MCGAGDKVALTRDAAFLQGLVEQVSLTRGDDGVGRAVHQEHRGARLADVVDGVGRLGCLLVGEDAAITAAEDRRAVNPEGFRRASRAVLCLDFFGEVGANLREVGEPVEVDSGLDIARDLEILALVERLRAARRTCHGRQVAACTAADMPTRAGSMPKRSAFALR